MELNTIKYSNIDLNILEPLKNKFLKEGYLIIENLFEKTFIEKINKYFQNEYKRYFVDKIHEDAMKVGDKRFHVTINIDGVFNTPKLYANEFILKFMESILTKKFVIEDVNCVISLPSSDVMHTHRDGPIFTNTPIANLLPPHAIGLLIPLIDFTNEVGPTRYWPGTHRTLQNPEEVENIPFLAPEISTGNAILMDYRLLHSGSPNLSNKIRPLLYVNYSTNWYLDSNNFKKQAHFLMDNENYGKVDDKFKFLFERRNLKFFS